MFGEILSIAKRNDDESYRIVALAGLAAAAREEGNLSHARNLLAECLKLVWDLRDFFSLPEVLDEAAATLAASGGHREAAHVYGAAVALRDTTGMASSAPDQVNAVLSQLRDQIGDELVQAATAEGRAMPTEDAIAYALGCLARADPHPASPSGISADGCSESQ